MGWIYLVFAGVFEIGFTTSMRYLGWPPRPLPLASSWSFRRRVSASCSRRCARFRVGTAYAVWTGIGAAGTVLIGMTYFDEPATAIRLALLVVLIGSIIGLKVVAV